MECARSRNPGRKAEQYCGDAVILWGGTAIHTTDHWGEK